MASTRPMLPLNYPIFHFLINWVTVEPLLFLLCRGGGEAGAFPLPEYWVGGWLKFYHVTHLERRLQIYFFSVLFSFSVRSSLASLGHCFAFFKGVHLRLSCFIPLSC
ncbi:hypothetical protein Y032_0042g714 [Ancylostoma ceylanicum]|uniref:Uncharacterized protein n=1 Tax=Ancylostoma ceylanicum TaxID=53326 RepID=A0A016UH17_9BILA|nr:hypothetical protein Y032_0042g714 [Ancylostoma ceylanicum]